MAELDIKQLERELHRETIEGANIARKLGYNPSYFLRMVSDIGIIQTAKQLMSTDKPSDGFTTLWELGRLDLSLEAQVLNPKYNPLFSDDERKICANRLKTYGYDVDGE